MDLLQTDGITFICTNLKIRHYKEEKQVFIQNQDEIKQIYDQTEYPSKVGDCITLVPNFT